MDDPIFDAIMVLVYSAEEEGFTSCAEALELVLDVYLMERELMFPAIPVFRSKRAERLRAIEDWTDDLKQDDQKQEVSVGWSMNNFPMLQAM